MSEPKTDKPNQKPGDKKPADPPKDDKKGSGKSGAEKPADPPKGGTGAGASGAGAAAAVAAAKAAGKSNAEKPVKPPKDDKPSAGKSGAGAGALAVAGAKAAGKSNAKPVETPKGEGKGESNAKPVETKKETPGQSNAEKPVETPKGEGKGESNAEKPAAPPATNAATQKPEGTPATPPPPAKGTPSQSPYPGPGSLKKRNEPQPDPTDMLGTVHAIDIHSIHSGTGVTFKAFVTAYSDSFTSNWNSVNAVGRMDPIQTFQNTQRVITIDFDVVASSLAEAKRNMNKCQRLAQMLYPSYSNASSKKHASLRSPPYFKFKFANLAADPSKNGPGVVANSPGKAASAGGLFGTLAGMEYTPDFDVGVYTSGASIYPKLVNLSLEFTVMHHFPLGYDIKGNARGKTFKSFPWNTSGGSGTKATTAPDSADPAAQQPAPTPEESETPEQKKKEKAKEVQEASEATAKPATDATKKVDAKNNKKVLMPTAGSPHGNWA